MSEEIIQGTQEWFDVRKGKATGSRMADLTAKTKTGYAALRENYKAQLIAERLKPPGSPPITTFMTQAMQDGKDREPIARDLYVAKERREVTQVGFIDHPRVEMAGCSPDGLVGPNGGLEIKCPQLAEHIRTLRTKTIQGKYVLQMQWCMACCPEREWWDYVSYNPDLPEEFQYFYKRITRHEPTINDLERQVREFLSEVDNEVQALRTEYQLTNVLNGVANANTEPV